MNSKKAAFSLIEILVGILIISIVMVAGFQTLSAIGIGKVKLIEKTKIEKESYFLAERFFEMIKKGGVLDYEEYWNRKILSSSYQSGHYLQSSGFGNFGKGGNPGSGGVINYGDFPYYCISEPGLKYNPGNTGCTGADYNIHVYSTILTDPGDQSGEPQRYGQYALQFIDYNSDADSDRGNENGSAGAYLRFEGDDDDLYLGEGPEAFSGSRVTELYLVNSKGNERTFFRWFVNIDPFAPTGATCTGSKDMTGSGCLGTIQVLKLKGEDSGFDHGLVLGGPWDDDGIIDTWLIHPDFYAGTTNVVAGSDTNSYWRNIFPDSVNVMDVEFHTFPNKDAKLAWKEANNDYQIAPYVQVKMTLSPSWKEKKKIRGKIPQSEFITTIGLTDLDLR